MRGASLARAVTAACATFALSGFAHSVLAAGPIPDAIGLSSFKVDLQSIATGLASPNYLTTAGDGSGRLFVSDQPGKIHLIKNGVKSTFLDVSSHLVSNLGNVIPSFGDYDERGLLSVAFHPDFANVGSAGFGKFYTYTSENTNGTGDYVISMPNGQPISHQNVISEWKVSAGNSDIADPTSRREILRLDHPQFNHDGGMLAFGPDKNLYISIGDGGNADDEGPGHSPGGNAQDMSRVLGKILRIDVNGTNGIGGKYGIPTDNPLAGDPSSAHEIFAGGFRNVFRFSFDKQTGALIAADVGQNNVEEVDIVTKGANYGWRIKEGKFKFLPGDPNNGGDGAVDPNDTSTPAGLTDPVAQYDHDEGVAIIGGFVYRGTAIPALQGKYIFGDYSRDFGPTGRLFVADLTTGLIEELKLGLDAHALGFYLKGFGQDDAGELYALVGGTLGIGANALTGQVLKLVAAPVPLPAAVWLLGPALGLVIRRRHAAKA